MPSLLMSADALLGLQEQQRTPDALAIMYALGQRHGEDLTRQRKRPAAGRGINTSPAQSRRRRQRKHHQLEDYRHFDRHHDPSQDDYYYDDDCGDSEHHRHGKERDSVVCRLLYKLVDSQAPVNTRGKRDWHQPHAPNTSHKIRLTYPNRRRSHHHRDGYDHGDNYRRGRRNCSWDSEENSQSDDSESDAEATRHQQLEQSLKRQQRQLQHVLQVQHKQQQQVEQERELLNERRAVLDEREQQLARTTKVLGEKVAATNVSATEWCSRGQDIARREYEIKTRTAQLRRRETELIAREQDVAAKEHKLNEVAAASRAKDAAVTIQRRWRQSIATREERMLLRNLVALKALDQELTVIVNEHTIGAASGTHNNLRVLSERLTKQLMKADAIDSRGQRAVRLERKAYVRRIMGLLDRADHHNAADSESNAEINLAATGTADASAAEIGELENDSMADSAKTVAAASVSTVDVNLNDFLKNLSGSESADSDTESIHFWSTTADEVDSSKSNYTREMPAPGTVQNVEVQPEENLSRDNHGDNDGINSDEVRATTSQAVREKMSSSDDSLLVDEDVSDSGDHDSDFVVVTS